MVAVVLLLLAFATLVGTFVWITRLLSARAREKKNKASRRAKRVQEQGLPGPEPEGADQPKQVRGRGYGANYGLLLGALACGLYWMSPLVLALAFVGGFYSGRALVNGVRHFRIVIWRSVIGSLLNIGGIVLQFGLAVGSIPPLV
jgi:hypothetical protein